MFTFTLLSPDDHSSKASLLTIDNDIRILADPSWNGKDHNDLDFFQDTLKLVNIILLSHSTPEFISGYVMLCLKFPEILKNIKVYSTSAVSQLGRVSTVEYYRSLGIIGPLKDALLEVSDVDDWFDKIISLKYFQATAASDRLSLIPYNSGHTLGGTFWLVQRKLEKIIYAPSWNHSKDSFLNSASFLSSSTGNPISQLMRPTALITGTDIGSPLPHKKRAQKFLQLVDATLANGGTVLLPTTISGRFLELLHLVDEHLKSAPIPVLFLSYSGTNVLRYATNLLEWMSSNLSKELEAANSIMSNSGNRNHFPFDPSKVDLVSSPYELAQLTGPKVVFTSGADFNNGDLSSEALRLLCNDEKTTIILTEKTHFGFTNNINKKLYTEWRNLCKSRNDGNVEDGIAVPLEIKLDLDNWTLEEDLVGNELTDFREKVNLRRKQKLIEQVRDRKNKVLTSENYDDSSSDSEGEDDDSETELPSQNDESQTSTPGPAEADEAQKTQNGTSEPAPKPLVNRPPLGVEVTSSIMDDAIAQEAIVVEGIKSSFDQNLPLDLKITSKLRPRHAMFPYFPHKDKQNFDDYGAIINFKDFERKDDTKTQFSLEGKRNTARNWGAHDDSVADQQGQNKLTPQEMLNNELIKNNLDTLFHPRKRIEASSTGSLYSSGTQTLQIRCGLSFVDLSGSVDLRSAGLIISALKPLNLMLLPDSSAVLKDEEDNGLVKLQSMLIQQQTQNEESETKNSLLKSARFMSLHAIRAGNFSNVKSNKMEILPVEFNDRLTIGSNESGLNVGDFEVRLDDSVINSLNWQTIDGSYKVARVMGQLEVRYKKNETKRQKVAADIINPSSEFLLKPIDPILAQEKQKISGSSAIPSLSKNKLAIGNIRLPELKRKLLSKNLNAEFKGEGTLVVNDCVSVTKVTYGNSDSDDTGDIVINGQIGPAYYQVKDCIKELLAYV